MLNTINLYNEKGNVKVSVRNAIKEKAMPTITKSLEATGRAVTVGTDGALYLPLAFDENGGTIYARLDITVSVKDPNAPVKEKAVKETETVEVELF